MSTSQGLHSHILMKGGGGPSDFFLSLKFGKSDFLGSMKDARIFLGHKKTEGFFWVVKKGLRDFFGYTKKVVIFLGRQILKV